MSHTSASPPGWEELPTAAGLALLARIAADRRGDDADRSTGNGRPARPCASSPLDRIGAALRAEGVDPGLISAALTQTELRERAAAKFGDLANRMLFTAAGLEQASRAPAADRHAVRFIAAGCTSVTDLGSGLGAESLAFRRRGLDVCSVEIDPLTADFARHNLQVLDAAPATPPPDEPSPAHRTETTVITGDATAIAEPLRSDGVFLDPARRTSGHRDTRRVSVDDYSPSLDFAFAAARAARAGGVKLGPGFPRDLIPDDAEAEWLSVDGAVVEMALWFGAAARPGVRRAATVIRTSPGDDGTRTTMPVSTTARTDGTEAAFAIRTHELTAPADSPDADPRPLGNYLYEPDGAVIRARLIGDLARTLDAGMVREGIAYLTGDRLVPTPFATAFRVLEALPASEKPLRRALRERGIGRLEIKKRGVEVDPAALRTRLKLQGEHSATVVLTRIADRHVALLVERT